MHTLPNMRVLGLFGNQLDTLAPLLSFLASTPALLELQVGGNPFAPTLEDLDCIRVRPHLISPHLTSPHLTSPHLTSPHLTSPHLISHLTSLMSAEEAIKHPQTAHVLTDEQLNELHAKRLAADLQDDEVPPPY